MLMEVIEERSGAALRDEYNRWYKANEQNVEVLKAEFHPTMGQGGKCIVVVWYRARAEHLPRRKRAKVDVSPEG